MNNLQCSPSVPKYKITLISVYIGQEPFWMPAFILSCKFNPQIHWLIYTDIPKPPFCPDNVQFVYMDLAGLNHRASEKLGLEIKIQQKYAYKICDLRPAFGVIFKDDLQSFSYWGHCDLDVVWGNIMTFIYPDILDKYDIITSRIRRISGHFCIFRNVPEINSTFQWIPRINAMMQDKAHHSVDEGHITDYLHVQNNPNWIVRLKQAFFGRQSVQPRIYWDKDLTTSGAHQRTMGEGTERCWWWKDGKVYNSDGHEVMYLHFHNIKKTMNAINFKYGDYPEKFMLTKQGITAC